jgi:hypothetical protein
MLPCHPAVFPRDAHSMPLQLRQFRTAHFFREPLAAYAIWPRASKLVAALIAAYFC